MSFLLRLCLGLVVLVPSLAHAATLENPGNGLSYSGVGVVSGWKCESNGSLTVSFLDGDMMPVGDPLPLVYGTERTDVPLNSSCDNANAGFVAIWNWGNLSDGTYTAVAKENDVEFGRSTFEVVTFGTDFLRDASGECRVPDFPMPGETTTFEWNQGTQHLEAVALDAACTETLTVESGETCSSSISLTTPLGDVSLGFTFSVEDGQGCISGGTPVDGCYPASLPAALVEVGVSIMKNTDGSWTIDSLPSVDLELPSGDLGICEEGLIVGPGAMCSGSLEIFGFEIDFGFSVDADGRGCAEVDLPPNFPADIDIGEIPCFNTSQEFENFVSGFQISDVSITKNDDGSWTIKSLPSVDLELPSVDLGECKVDLIIEPGAMCDGSIGTPVGDIDYTFSVKADGEACIEAEVDIPFVDDLDECFNTIEELEDVLDDIEDLLDEIDIDIDIDDFVTKNVDGSWTITDLFF